MNLHLHVSCLLSPACWDWFAGQEETASSSNVSTARAPRRVHYWFCLNDFGAGMCSCCYCCLLHFGYYEYWVKKQSDKHRGRASKHTTFCTMIKWMRARKRDGKSMLLPVYFTHFVTFGPGLIIIFNFSLLYQHSTVNFKSECVLVCVLCRLVAFKYQITSFHVVWTSTVSVCWLTGLVGITTIIYTQFECLYGGGISGTGLTCGGTFRIFIQRL